MAISQKDANRGWDPRYHITKSDGSPTDPKAEYFVLRLDEDDPHGVACRKAILTYADAIESHIPKLAKDIREKFGET